jgi:hypothetical protein
MERMFSKMDMTEWEMISEFKFSFAKYGRPVLPYLAVANIDVSNCIGLMTAYQVRLKELRKA